MRVQIILKLIKKMKFSKKTFFSLLTVFCVFLLILIWKNGSAVQEICPEYNHPEDFEGFDNITGTTCDIIPNIVHFIRFGQPEFTFVDLICVLAALKNQKPERIFFHTDMQFRGKWWDYLLEQKGFNETVRIVQTELPTEIFGQELQPFFVKYHGSDIVRIKIMMEYGGIYLDNDCFIVRRLNEFFKYEITLGWGEGNFLHNQVIIANKNARFLREWLLSYKGSYDENEWYYNAGERPTTEILSKRPELVHRMKEWFNEYLGILELLFVQRDEMWKRHYVFHLFIRTVSEGDTMQGYSKGRAIYPVIFNEKNILRYPVTFRDLVASVYPLF